MPIGIIYIMLNNNPQDSEKHVDNPNFLDA
jgi:hypothetical protein